MLPRPEVAEEYDDQLYEDTPGGRAFYDDDYQRRWERDQEVQEALYKTVQAHLDGRKGYEREVQDELSEEIADLKDDLLIATPSRLAIFLTPKIFGTEAEFLLDPWLKLLEQRAMGKLLSPKQEFLGVNAIPQGGKSTYCGLFLPLWIAGFFPDKRQIKIAYSEGLAAQTGRVLRDLVKVYGPALFGLDIDPNNEKVTDFTFKAHLGGVLSAGLGGSITGRSGDCVLEGTLIATPTGLRPVEDVAAEDRPTILSWDEHTNRVVEAEVDASRSTAKTACVEIRTTGGRTLRCTPDHRVFVAGRGYVQAHLLRPGDRLRSLPGLRPGPAGHATQGEAAADAHRVLPSGTRQELGDLHLRHLRGRVHDDAGRRAQAPEAPAGWRPDVLHGMLRSSASNEVSVRPADRHVERGAVLLGGVHRRVREATEVPRHLLRVVREGLPAAGLQDEVLLEAMCLQAPRQDDARQEQLEPPPRTLPPSRLSEDAALHPSARWQPLRRVRDDGEPLGPPHRRGPIQQRRGEPHHSLPRRPHAAPQVEDDTVSVVEHLREEPRVFFDLSVPGPRNFFADGVLVHNCIFIDDLIKNMQEAGSKTTKDFIETEYYGTARTRLQPGGFVLLSATRFAADDLSGRLKESQKDPNYDGDDWEWLKFDAIATPERRDPLRFEDSWRDCLGRRKGEPLQTRFDKGRDLSSETPEQWKTSHFYIMKRAFANNMAEWSAIYQQNPTSPTGGMFPEAKWRYYDPAPELRDSLPQFIAMRRVWDLAATEGGGDWTVGALTGKTNSGNFYILDVQRFQKGADEVQKAIRQTLAVDGFAVPIMVEEEKGGSGKHNTAFFSRELAPAYVKAALPQGKKEDRARPYSNLQQSGKVFLPKSPEGADPDWTPQWLQLFIDEHAAMMGDGRSGRHDDIVDVVAYAVNDMLTAAETEVRDSGLRDFSNGMEVASVLGSSWGR